MLETPGWSQLEKEARGAFKGKDRFVVRAYSEYMPVPYAGIKKIPRFRGHPERREDAPGVFEKVEMKADESGDERPRASGRKRTASAPARDQ
jgi:hypothetical protein